MDVSRLVAGIPERSEAERRQMRANAGRKLLDGTPAEQVAAQTVVEALDAHEQAARDALRARLKDAPVAQRVVEAFRAMPATDTDVKVIQALAVHPGSTSSDLTRACGWQGQSWHLHFGLMCFNREAWLWPAEPFEKRDAKFYSGILADFDGAGHTFTMKPEVRDAFVALGIVRGA